MDYEAARRNMVESQIRTNKVTHAALLDALSAVPRERFLPPDRAFAAYVDDAAGRARALSDGPWSSPGWCSSPSPPPGVGRYWWGGRGYGAPCWLGWSPPSRRWKAIRPGRSRQAGARRPDCRERHPGGRPWPRAGRARRPTTSSSSRVPSRRCPRRCSTSSPMAGGSWQWSRQGDGPRDAVHRAEQGHLPRPHSMR